MILTFMQVTALLHKSLAMLTDFIIASRWIFEISTNYLEIKVSL